MNRNNHQLYNKVVAIYLSNNDSAFMKACKDKSLSKAEKELLFARQLCHQKKWNDVVLNLEKLKTPSAFLVAEKHLILASAHSYIGNFKEAKMNNEIAFSYYSKCDDTIGQYSSRYHLSMSLNKMGLIEDSYKEIQNAEFFAETDGQRSSLAKAKALYYFRNGDRRRACEYIDIAFKYAKKNTLNHNILKSVASEIYFSLGKQKRSIELLEELNSTTSYINKENIALRLCIHKVRMKGFVIGKTPRAFKDSRLSSLQWGVLRAIQQFDLDYAKNLWQEIVNHAPYLYGEEFTCLDNGENNGIFMTYLRELIFDYNFKMAKAEKAQKQVLVEQEESEEKKSKLTELYDLFVNACAPLKKEELIEKLWNITYDSSYDSQIEKLILKLRTENGVNVINYNNAYLVAA